MDIPKGEISFYQFLRTADYIVTLHTMQCGVATKFEQNVLYFHIYSGPKHWLKPEQYHSVKDSEATQHKTLSIIYRQELLW